uniref:Ion transport domain-containing protein n=1 Tax=Meloidogyne javanica TaxID=6303 RepID=A0A915N2G0_MELJA
MGVQLFGRMEFHCVLPGTDPNNVTIADLAIPDTMCSPDGQGYECPPTMECMKLSLRANQIGFYGMFNDFASSLFTVYLAASQEGWVFVLYDTLDTFPYYFGLFYFITLIFFLAWLVKNVFIAVITETFAEIRVQFSEMWQSREVPPNNRNQDNINQNKLEKDEEGDWHIKEVDSKLLNFGVTERGTFRLFRLLRLVKISPMLEDFVYKEGWTDVVVEILRSTNEYWVPFVAIYFVGYHLFVTLIVLSLFVAVILDNLEMDEELKKIKQLKAREETTTMRTQLPWRLRIFEKFPSRPQMIEFRKIESNKQRSLLSDTSQHIGGVNAWIRGAIGGVTRRRHEQENQQQKIFTFQNVENKKENGGDISKLIDTAPKENTGIKSGGLDIIDIKALQRKRDQAEFTRNRIEEEMRENHPFFDSPLFIVGRNSRLRRWCLFILNKYKQIKQLIGLLTYLDWTMVLITLFSCFAMLFESPWPISGENMIFKNKYFEACDFIFVLAMSIELTLKIVAHGLFFTPNAVVRDVGGFATLFIFGSSLWYLIWMPKYVQENSFAQFLMICRAMRPLRIYTLVPHIRQVVVELCKGFREILLVTILLILFMFMFASFGLQFIGGKLAACNDPTITSKAIKILNLILKNSFQKNCVGLFEQKLFVTRMEVFGKNDENLHPKMLVPRVWTNPRNFNFDHIGNAMLALFETLSYKGWNGPWAVLFIHVYVFIGCMIGLTLFVDVVIANYMENRGTALLTVDQRRWHDLKARLRMAQPLHVPPRPAESSKIRNRLYELTTSRSFKQFYAILVVLNSATLIVPWSVEEEEQRRTLLLIFTSFAGICSFLFTIEILLKSIAFTPHGFWQSRRNRVDLLITCVSIFWLIAHFGISEVALPIVSLPPSQFRRFTYTLGYIIGILRFFTITGRKSTLKMLMLTVRSAFIIAAMFLLILFYAYAGVILFGTVRYGQALSKHVNFRSGKQALMVLFRSITGEDWNDIMHDCMRSPPHCYWAPSLKDALLSYADIRNYQQVNNQKPFFPVWNMVDLEQKHSIPVRRVKFLLRLLRGRLEVDLNKDKLLFKHMCHEMERLNNGEDVSFHDILSMLSYRSVDIRKSLQLDELVQREELEYLIEEEVAKQTIRDWLESCLIKNKQLKKQQQETAMGDLLTQIRSTTTTQTCQTKLLLKQPISPKKQIKCDSRKESSPNKKISEGNSEIEQLNKVTEKVDKRRRSSSIPELVEEAKRFVWGGRLKSLPRINFGRQRQLQSTNTSIKEEGVTGSNKQSSLSPLNRTGKTHLSPTTFSIKREREEEAEKLSVEETDVRRLSLAAYLQQLDSTNYSNKRKIRGATQQQINSINVDNVLDWWDNIE